MFPLFSSTDSIILRMIFSNLKPDCIVRGSIFPEPVKIITTIPIGKDIKLVGKGMLSGRVYDPIISEAELANLEISPEKNPFNGDPERFRLGIEAYRLSLAYEYDPFFSLSISRIDPFPHQLEAVYEYFMKIPRIRFLLADDPGAGKTIMAGLLIKELKVRGLIDRVLIVSPANLTFQWQRELLDKFREPFDIVRGSILRANYGVNPWQEKKQVITSIDWIARIDDARESLYRSTWDLIIVDEAHKMSAYSEDKKTLRYQLGEHLSEITDHFLLMTATPHKGDPENFCLFLELLDKDVYGSVKSLEEAMRRNYAPFYLRRKKDSLITFPDSETGEVRKLFTKRDVKTSRFELDGEEYDFYDELTRYVENQSIKAASEDDMRSRALGFTMALLQRRFASSVYALRRTLERMKEKRENIIKNPTEYIKKQLDVPEDFEDLPEDEQESYIDQIENASITFDPSSLKREIEDLSLLISKAKVLEKREIESKLIKLKALLTEQKIFSDPKMKILIFTEHKDTLYYLAGNEKEGIKGKLKEWGLKVTQIHGGMKPGDRDTPGTRLYAERDFKEDAQVLVATEAAGEGINLQFCWLMVNYDIPWNPVRLEQRMGRIHRIGQEHDCMIFNFVAINTREGRVLQELLRRLDEIGKELGTDQVFDVIGEVFPSNLLEKMFRDLYAQRTNLERIEDRIVKNVDIKRFREITDSALEGLAKKELNLVKMLGKSSEAKEKRLVPEIIERFFKEAGPMVGANVKKTSEQTYAVSRIPKDIVQIGQRLEPKCGKLGKEYKSITFNKEYLKDDPTREWVTPGHPLFEAVREATIDRVRDDMQKGAVYYDVHAEKPYRLDVYAASATDGRGNVLHRKLFVVQANIDGSMAIRQPTLFLDLTPGPAGIATPEDSTLPTLPDVERELYEQELKPFCEKVKAERLKEIETIKKHLHISLNELINRQNLMLADLIDKKTRNISEQGIDGRISQAETRVEELNMRLETRSAQLDKEKNCLISDIQHLGRAWAMPHPERGSFPMTRDDEIERIAMQEAMKYEKERGWEPLDVSAEDRGFDILSKNPKTVEARFIEVKGRVKIGEIALSRNEYETAQRLRKDYWLYAVYNCADKPEIHPIQDPITLGWEQIIKIQHYQIKAEKIIKSG